jgi:general secretion pathway protein D
VIKVGQEVPFLTGQYTNTQTTGGTNQPTNPFQTIERKDVGLQLTVTPHINEGDSVRLDIKQEVSSLAPTTTGAVDLVTNRRLITTSVVVRNGTMLVLGGLTSDEVKESVSKVPALGDIPVLGQPVPLPQRHQDAPQPDRVPQAHHPAGRRDGGVDVEREVQLHARAADRGARGAREPAAPEDHPVLPAEQPPPPRHDEPPGH